MLTGAALIWGNFLLAVLKKTSTGLFLFYLICFISVCGSASPHPNDDENWKRWGSPKKGLRKESHHFSEGDMGTKPQVLEGSASFCPLGDRELKGGGQTWMLAASGPSRPPCWNCELQWSLHKAIPGDSDFKRSVKAKF